MTVTIRGARSRDVFLVNTGRPVPGKDEKVEDLREGRVYVHTLDRLEPRHGGPLPVGSYLAHGEWFDVPCPPLRSPR